MWNHNPTSWFHWALRCKTRACQCAYIPAGHRRSPVQQHRNRIFTGRWSTNEPTGIQISLDATIKVQLILEKMPNQTGTNITTTQLVLSTPTNFNYQNKTYINTLGNNAGLFQQPQPNATKMKLAFLETNRTNRKATIAIDLSTNLPFVNNNETPMCLLRWSWFVILRL